MTKPSPDESISDQLVSRLIFGCSRLTGYACQGESNKLIETCIQFGITRFDTAPSYGLGTAERALRLAVEKSQARDLRTGDNVAVTIKAGSGRPNARALRTCLRRAKRSIASSYRMPSSPPAQFTGGVANFGRKDIHASVEESLEHLSGMWISTVLMHEALPEDLTPTFISDLRAMQTEWTTPLAIGISNSFQFDTRMQDSVPAEFVVQAALNRKMLYSPMLTNGRKTIFHSIPRMLSFESSQYAEFDKGLGIVLAGLGLGESPTMSTRLALIYVVLATTHPACSFIFSTSRPNHCAEFLTAIQNIDAHFPALEVVDRYESAFKGT